ncbi:anaphase-promoting complex subunit 5-like [Liolophura sinensis]|uniref:anaphase-promoting complex subunit 5-like n=1 Tax=Liolophura sinensis TaxID=3198878 RepID=UPI003159712A
MDAISVGVFAKKPLKEVVTPHKLSVLSLIYDYSVMKSKSDEKYFTQKQMRNFMTCVLKLLQSPDVPLQKLLNNLKGTLSPSLQEAFSNRLKEFYSDGVSPIMDFFQTLSELLSTDRGTVISKTSFLGMFIRRMILAFEKLSFSQVISLYGRFKLYYEAVYPPAAPTDEENGELSKSIAKLSMSLPSFQNLPKSNLTKNLEDLSLSEGYGKEITEGFYSQKQAELFITQQVFLLQHNENEAMPPDKLQDKISEILKINPDLTEAHFLSYLNNLRVKEYCTAIHNHYHYFDRHKFTSTDSGNSSNKSKDEDIGRRYAALNLASLHFRFGHRKESLAALQEAIKLAQESNDHVCLQHALGWLYRFRLGGERTAVNQIERSTVNCDDLNLPYLTSLGFQAYARHDALSGVKPASIFEHFVKSDSLSCKHSQLNFMCISYAQKAALWQMYGKREMSSMCSQLILHLDTSDCGIYHCGEPGCIALCTLAKHHTHQGCYSAAYEVINNIKKHYPASSQYAHIWMACEQEVNFTKAMLAGNWSLAEESVDNMRAVCQHEADIRRAVLLKERGETTVALTLLHKLLKEDQEWGEEHLTDELQFTTEYRCRLLLLLSELLCQTGSAMVAIPHLLDCLTQARRHHLEYLAALAGVYLAYVQLHILMPNQALSLLDEHLKIILVHGTVYDKARVLYLYAKCQVAATSKQTSKEKKSVLLSVAAMMTSVIDLFTKVEAHHRVKDAVYFQARLYHDLGYKTERNNCARKFRQLDQQNPTLSQVLVNGV